MKKVTPEVSRNFSFLGNPSFDIYVDWENVNEKSDDVRRKGKYYIKKIVSRVSYNKWINIDKVEKELKESLQKLYLEHPYLRTINEAGIISSIKKEFDGLYYHNHEVEEYRKEMKTGRYRDVCRTRGIESLLLED